MFEDKEVMEFEVGRKERKRKQRGLREVDGGLLLDVPDGKGISSF